jgi:hypothetical protein
LDDTITVTIEFETEDDAGTYKCFDLVVAMIEDGVEEALDELKKNK